jgi:hypothetical protein
VEIHFVSHTREHYQSEAHRQTGLPAAPAVLVEEEIVLQGPEISEERLETALKRRLAG